MMALEPRSDLPEYLDCCQLGIIHLLRVEEITNSLAATVISIIYCSDKKGKTTASRSEINEKREVVRKVCAFRAKAITDRQITNHTGRAEKQGYIEKEDIRVGWNICVEYRLTRELYELGRALKGHID